MNVGEHATYTRLEVFFEKVDAPDRVVTGVEKDAMRMVAPEAATLTVRMRRGKRDKADATNLTALPHSDCRSPFPAHRGMIGEDKLLWKCFSRLADSTCASHFFPAIFFYIGERIASIQVMPAGGRTMIAPVKVASLPP
jgi:hypothetical protein